MPAPRCYQGQGPRSHLKSPRQGYVLLYSALLSQDWRQFQDRLRLLPGNRRGPNRVVSPWVWSDGFPAFPVLGIHDNPAPLVARHFAVCRSCPRWAPDLKNFSERAGSPYPAYVLKIPIHCHTIPKDEFGRHQWIGFHSGKSPQIHAVL